MISVWPSTFEDAVPKVIRDKVYSEIFRTIGENKPQTFYISSACYSDNTKQMLDELLATTKAIEAKEYLLDTPNFIVSGDFIPFEWLMYNPIQPFCKIELDNNEKEKEKMEAKRCDRCGKLYDLVEDADYILSYMPGRYVSQYEKDNYTDAKIRHDKTSPISIIYHTNKSHVELCPECRKKLKNFFESGKDGDMELPIRDINAEE